MGQEMTLNEIETEVRTILIGFVAPLARAVQEGSLTLEDIRAVKFKKGDKVVEPEDGRLHKVGEEIAKMVSGGSPSETGDEDLEKVGAEIAKMVNG